MINCNITKPNVFNRQGEKSENVYIVLNGRLRSVYSNDHTAKKEFAGQIENSILALFF